MKISKMRFNTDYTYDPDDVTYVTRGVFGDGVDCMIAFTTALPGKMNKKRYLMQYWKFFFRFDKQDWKRKMRGWDGGEFT
jgi:hypothetical protein